MSFVITGMPRSGTKSMSAMLGIAHEEQFTPDSLNDHLLPLPSDFRDEVSWMAAPFVPTLLRADVRILHLVRHPLKVIGSLLARDFFNSERHRTYREFLYRHLPKISVFCPDPWENAPDRLKALYTWFAWNKVLVQRRLPIVRIEDMGGAPMLNGGRRQQTVCWSGLGEDRSLRAEAQDLAIQVGYTKGGLIPNNLLVNQPTRTAEPEPE